MSRQVYAIEVKAYDPDAAAEITLTYAEDGFATKSGDTPANRHFAPRIMEAGNFSQFLVDALVTSGRSRAGYGEIVLANLDGELDALAGYGFDGRELVVRYGRIGDAYPAAWDTVMTGTISQIEATLAEVRLLIRDRQAEVRDLPYQPTKYAGSNSLPNGVEGVEDDLQGKPKPRLRGQVNNISPPAVNTSKFTYQVSDKVISSLDAVYVGGLAVPSGSGHASLAALQAAAVTAGTYDWYLGGGGDGAFFRLGTAPDNVVTCDATEGASASNRTAAQIAKQILLDVGIDAGDIDSASVTALDTANNAVIGVWTGSEEQSAGSLLDAVLGSVGGYWNIDATGNFYFGRLEDPASGTAVQTIKSYQLISSSGQAVERLRGRGENDGLPAWRVVLNYRKNYTVQRGGDVVAAVAQARRALLAEEWRNVTYDDTSVKTTHLLASERQVYSLIVDVSDASDEAERQQVLHGVKREFLRIQVPTSQLSALARKPGSIVELEMPRFDWSSGKKYVVTGVTDVRSARLVTLELWG